MRIQQLPAIFVMTVAGFFTSVSALDSHDMEEQLITRYPPVKPYHGEAMTEKCHGLSKEFHDFGALLNKSNQKTFCAKFTDEQRKKAMQIAGKKDGRATKMTPDQAVEKVAEEGT